jgi:putative transcriptional regulator
MQGRAGGSQAKGDAMSKQSGTKRDIVSELMEGVDAMGAHRNGKVTLRTHSLPDAEVKKSPGAEFFVAARERFNVSRAVWADMLRVSPRTVEKWEQGGQVSPLAATFVELVTRYPDTIDRLQTLPKRVSWLPKTPSHDSNPITVKQLFNVAELPVCGPVRWKDERVPDKQPGVYVVATVSCPDDEVGMEDVAGLPTKVARRWVPSQPILYVGETTRPLSTRIDEFYRHKYGAKSPHRGGQDVKLLDCPLWIYWSPTERPVDAEKSMIWAFVDRVGYRPFGNLKLPSRSI